MAFKQTILLNETVSQTTATPSVELGTERISGPQKYAYFYNASNSLIEVGVPCVVATGSSGYSVTATNSASQIGWGACVVHNASVPTGNYFWGVVRGPTRMVPDASQVSANAAVDVTLGVDGGFVAMTGATLSTGLRLGYTISSMVTGYGACASFATSGLACLGQGWFRGHLA